MWLTKGDVVFDRVWFRYGTDHLTQSSAAFALQDVSFAVADGDKVGVIDCTGSGKSWLAMALVCVHGTARGRILVDGADICRLQLSNLRGRLCIFRRRRSPTAAPCDGIWTRLASLTTRSSGKRCPRPVSLAVRFVRTLMRSTVSISW